MTRIQVYKGKVSVSNTWCWKNWTATCKRMKLHHFIMPSVKRHKYLNVRPESIKLLEEDMDGSLTDIALRDVFVDLPLHQGQQKQK